MPLANRGSTRRVCGGWIRSSYGLCSSNVMLLQYYVKVPLCKFRPDIVIGAKRKLEPTMLMPGRSAHGIYCFLFTIFK